MFKISWHDRMPNVLENSEGAKLRIGEVSPKKIWQGKGGQIQNQIKCGFLDISRSCKCQVSKIISGIAKSYR